MVHTSQFTAGSILNNRYEILRELGQGGFGRTYLAQDLHQAREYCVLKEFAPQVHGENELQKAKELFQREAGVLYKLQHPQIPRFRELLDVKIGGTENLFLVQDYVEGQTYWQLLQSYHQQNRRFSEADVTQLLQQLLPVLEYIHSLGVVHRDIAPDNLIQRSVDKLPILIDFGGVKEVAVTAVSLYSRFRSPTRIGKEGYAPDEQLIRGKVSPSSDLYALAVTVLVLLTGKEPQEFYDAAQATWQWRREVNISRTLGNVLDRMLAHRPSDRYQSAREVILALQAGDPQISHMRTINVVGNLRNPQPDPIPQNTGTSNNGTQIIPPATRKLLARHGKAIAIGISITLLTGITAWGLFNAGISLLNPEPSARSQPNTSLSKTEQARQTKIFQRSQALKIPSAAFYRQVDTRFYAQHPELRRRALTSNPEDAKFRQRWYAIAEDLLAQLEKQANQ